MQKNNIEKRFPASTDMTVKTFLNDKQVDGELYAILQSCSYPEVIDGVETTVVRKGNRKLPTKKKICEMLGIRTTNTLNAHMKVLVEAGFLKKIPGTEEDYILPEQEKSFLMIPLDTLQYFHDTVKPLVIKTFVYLGQKWKMKEAEGKGERYSFTVEEIGRAVGLNMGNSYSENYRKINNALDLLTKIGLISFADYFDGQSPRKRLTAFQLHIKK